MLSISHATTGAVIATKLGNPYLFVPLVLLSHYLEDAVPHWDAGTGLGSGKKTRHSALIHGSIDLALAGITVLIFYPGVLSNLPTSLYDFRFLTPIFGAFIGLIPDFLEAPRNFLKWEPAFMKPINRFHHSFHHSIPRMLDGLAPQLLLLILLWLAR